MNTIALNNLWSYLQGLSLSTSNKKWLSDRLMESVKDSNTLTDKEKELESLSGVWAGEDGARMAEAIKIE